jgi:hypothetical protein
LAGGSHRRIVGLRSHKMHRTMETQ